MGSWLEVTPGAEMLLQAADLHAPGDFTRLQGTILGGHVDRHVQRVTLNGGHGTVTAYLKKEHRISWKTRCKNWLSGHGWVGHSVREGRLLRQAARAAILAPRVLAFGEHGGQGFLLLAAIAQAQDVRTRLGKDTSNRSRRCMAKRLAQNLAQMHDQGFRHPELSAKHLLANPGMGGLPEIFVLDWQRVTWENRPVSWHERCRDLASLQATVHEALADDRLRWLTLLAYRRASRCALPPARQLAQAIKTTARGMVGNRRVREIRQPAPPQTNQNLVWLAGEALCVSPDWLQEIHHELPTWLTTLPQAPPCDLVLRRDVSPGSAATWVFTRRWATLSRWRRSPFPAPEFEQVGTMVRLQRFGVNTARVLALGHRDLPDRRKYSFLLTALPTPLQHLGETWVEDGGKNSRFVGWAGACLRKIHEAGYGLCAGQFQPEVHWAIAGPGDQEADFLLTSAVGVQRQRGRRLTIMQRDLLTLRPWLDKWTDTQALRFLLAYSGQERVTSDVKRWWRLVRPQGWGQTTKVTPPQIFSWRLAVPDNELYAVVPDHRERHVTAIQAESSTFKPHQARRVA